MNLLISFPILLILIFEILHRSRQTSPLQIKPFAWNLSEQDNRVLIDGWLEICNPHNKMEVMIPELEIKTTLLGNLEKNNLIIKHKIIPHHPNEHPRDDDYWYAYILKGNCKTKVRIEISISTIEGNINQISIESVWMDILWVNYGPFGRQLRREGFIVSEKPKQTLSHKFQEESKCKVLPISTHLLGSLDDPFDVINKYSKDIAQPGDILTIGETPLAIMQGRYIHPSNIMPSFLAKTLCRSFHPTSSLATACGLQILIDIEGTTRIIFAWLIGVILKIIGIRGGFYRIAGEQARLIDDITGTTPPYDQTIVLGPKSTQELCNEVINKLGISLAIVDVNDLGRVKILASSKNTDEGLVIKALRRNPAGNANEQTPIVLIRPS